MKDNDSFRIFTREQAERALFLIFCACMFIFFPYARADVHGVSLEAGYADCRFTPSPNGQYWQNDSDHSSRYKSGCGSFGLSFQVNPDWDIGLHWVTLGRADVNAIAFACPADDCTKLVKQFGPQCQDKTRMIDNCAYRWNSSSYARGVHLSSGFRIFSIGPVDIQAKAGLFAHKLSNHAVAQNTDCWEANCPWRAVIDQEAFRITPTWGAAAKWKYLGFSWEAFENIGTHTPVTANVKGRVEVKTIFVRIPL